MAGKARFLRLGGVPDDVYELIPLILVVVIVANIWMYMGLKDEVTPNALQRASSDRFDSLLVPDLLVGIMRMDAEGPPALHLSGEQRTRLLALEPRLRDQMTRRTEDRDGQAQQAVDLEAQMGGCLRDEQKKYLLDLFKRNLTRPKVGMDRCVMQFIDYLKTTSSQR